MELYFLPSTFTSLDASSGEELFSVTESSNENQLTCQHKWGGEVKLRKLG